MNLADLQHAFQAHVVDGVSPPPPACVNGERGYRVYRHAYRATLRDALRDTYARTAAWLGDEAFDAVTSSYVATVRSTSWTLGDYGDLFVDALAAAHPDDPEVAELAWLEWHLRRAFSAASARPVDRETLTSVDWERASLGLQPSLAARIVMSDVAGIWRALGEERAPGRVLLPITGGLVVWRDGLQPRFRTTTATEADALEALLAGETFAQVARGVGGDPGEIGGMLARWLDDGLVASVS